ncbi:MAG: hypothetical protein ACYCSZ_14755 [Burkholderiales bacterium]
MALIAHALDSSTTDLTPLQNRLRNALAQAYQRVQDWGGDRLQINLADGCVLRHCHLLPGNVRKTARSKTQRVQSIAYPLR